MKAIVYRTYGSPAVLQLEDREKPVPGDKEVLIRVSATVVTATDAIFRKGKPFISRLATGLRKPKNHVLGDALSGTVEAIGSGVTSWKVGDRLFGSTDATMGAHAEYICLSETGSIVPKPSEMPDEDAAALCDGGLTALPFLRDEARIRSGQKILIIGASGGIGTVAVQLAKYFGAHVTGVCSTANIEMVKMLGADAVIDYTKEDATRNGLTYDVIFDTVGKSSFARCKRSLKKNGFYLTTVLGISILLHMLGTSIAGGRKARIAFTGLRPAAGKKKDLEFLKQLFTSGRIKPVIDRRYPLERIAEAHSYVDGGHKRGNVIIALHPDGDKEQNRVTGAIRP